jgi:hypothetical protein
VEWWIWGFRDGKSFGDSRTWEKGMGGVLGEEIFFSFFFFSCSAVGLTPKAWGVNTGR